MGFATKKYSFTLFSLLVFSLLVSSFGFADVGDQYHLTLLAVQEQPDGSHIGSTANLFVEVRKGSGRVFLDTTPLTKLDTQVSTRFAKQVACDYYDLPCEEYDFFYAITSDTGIIGGPSAGAAMAALTSLAVMDVSSYNSDVAITGTINSGGIVGPVGGVKEKIQAADDLGLDIVLVPLTALDEELTQDQLDSSSSNSTLISNQSVIDGLFNYTFDNVSLGEFVDSSLSIHSFEVSELDDIMYHLTGKRYLPSEIEFTRSEEYDSLMSSLQTDLCDRSSELYLQLQTLSSQSSTNVDVDWKHYQDRLTLAKDVAQAKDYYAAGSFCFGLNTQLQYDILTHLNFDLEGVSSRLDQLSFELDSYETVLDSIELETISDLQTSIVVSERMSDARNQIEVIQEFLEEQPEFDVTDDSQPLNVLQTLAYAIERSQSASSWMLFFEMDGALLDIDDSSLSFVCDLKLAEAQERYNYASVYVPFSLERIQSTLLFGEEARDTADYSLCIAQAIQAKADSTSILSSSGISNASASEFMVVKERAAARSIAYNSRDNSFPILGYSYYQYAQNLEDTEPYSALLYYEYALEMSELDVYFPQVSSSGVEFDTLALEEIDFWSFLAGLFAGIGVGSLLMWLLSQGISSKK